jgi:hypothetical protein
MLQCFALLLVPYACVNAPPTLPLPLWKGAIQQGSNGRPEVTYLTPDLNSIVLIDENSQIHLVSLNRRVSPSASVLVTPALNSKLHYEYRLTNNADAIDAIHEFTLLVPETIESSALDNGCGRLTTIGWVGGIGRAFATQCEIRSVSKWRYAGWVKEGSGKTVHPGTSLAGPCLDSALLPGITTGYFGGTVPLIRESYLTVEAISRLRPIFHS